MFIGHITEWFRYHPDRMEVTGSIPGKVGKILRNLNPTFESLKSTTFLAVPTKRETTFFFTSGLRRLVKKVVEISVCAVYKILKMM